MSHFRNRQPTHPGILFRRLAFSELGMTQEEFAEHIGISRKQLNLILNGNAPITADVALRFGMAIGGSGEIYLRQQAKYDLWLAQQKKPNIKRIINA